MYAASRTSKTTVPRDQSGPKAAAKSKAALSRLASLSEERGTPDTRDKLRELEEFVTEDLSAVEHSLSSYQSSASRGKEANTKIHQAAFHLLRIPGKHVRPMCVSLAARSSGLLDDFDTIPPHIRDVAVAAELVHNATLLHDDVVDLGETRRGQNAARVEFGNAAAVFAGDWLLIRALQLVQRATLLTSPDIPTSHEILSRLLQVVEEMIDAEAIQLEHRGTFTMATDDYFRVIRGKTAKLFQWACFAGGCLGQLTPEHVKALEDFGHHLGIAFQLTDDALDYEGDPEVTGKAALQDLREGKATFPLLRALEISGAIREQLEGCSQSDDVLLDAHRSVTQSGALVQCRELAAEHAQKAHQSLQLLPLTNAKQALQTMANSIVTRET